MIRETLPDNLKDYFNDIDEVQDFSQCEVLQRINFWLFTLTLYRLSDLYKVLGKDEYIYIYSLTIGKKKRTTVNCTDILGGVFKWNNATKHATANYPIAFINAICCVLFKRWNAFILTTYNKGMFDDGDTPENFSLALKNVAYNNIQAVRFIKTLDTTDCDKIYAIGVSLGALTLEGTYAIENSYKKAVIIIGGYPLTNIIANSEEGMVKGFYERMIALFGNAAFSEIRSAIKLIEDVYQYAPGDGIFQIMMEDGDTSVPSEYQIQYKQIIRPKEVLALKYRKLFAIGELKNGHYQTLLYYPYLIYRSLKFLGRD